MADLYLTLRHGTRTIREEATRFEGLHDSIVAALHTVPALADIDPYEVQSELEGGLDKTVHTTYTEAEVGDEHTIILEVRG